MNGWRSNAQPWQAKALHFAEHPRPVRLDDGVLVAFDSGAAGKPQWNRLFPMGATKYRADMPDGKLCFDKAWCAELVANAKAILAKGHRIQGNYHHFGGDDVDPSTPLENTIASGWILDVELREDGPYALIEWTEKAKGFIGAKELMYLSPEFYLSWMNRDTGKKQGPTLSGFALTNTPFLKELPPVAAAEQSNPAESSANNGAKRMDKKLLCALLGLAEDAAEDAIQLKLRELMAAGADLTKLKEAAAVKLKETEAQALKLKELQAAAGAEVTTLRDSTVKLTERVGELEKQNATLLSERKTTEVKAYLDGLVKAGKVTPALREGFEKLALTSGLEAIKFLDKATPVVPVGVEVGVGGSGAPESAQSALTKLGEIARGIVKDTGIKLSEAKIRAMELHPELAKQAAELKSPIRA